MAIQHRFKLIASIIIGIGILALLIYFSDIEEIISLLSKINPIWIILAILVYNINWLLRGYRWQLILDSMGHRIKLKDSISLTVLGNFANLVTPAKIGDTVRALVLKKKDSVALSKGLSSIVIDRASDFFGVVVLTYLSFMLISTNLILPDWIKLLITGSYYILVGGFVTVSMLSKIQILEKILVKSNISKKYLFPLFQNIKMVYKKKILTKLAVSSIVLWIFEISTAFILLYPLGYLGNPYVVIFAIMVGNLTKTLPLTPGGIGAYEGAVAAVFAVGGLSYTVGLTVGILDHAIKNIYTIVLGAFSLSYNGVEASNFSELQRTSVDVKRL
jgi:uncharacterized protein (TIRG00374 family)